MKKFIIILLTVSLMQFAYAADTANIKIKIAGAMRDNRYFLCLQNIGCLSILAAEKKGKIYRIMHEFNIPTVYVTEF